MEGYVAQTNVRSTLEIFWSCVTILILCSWSILHLNVPAQYTPQSKSQKVRRYIWSVSRKAKWTLFTLVAPEVILAKAVLSRQSARSNFPRLKKHAEEDGVPWSLAHTFMADIGGYVIHFPEDESDAGGHTQQTGTDLPHRPTPSQPVRRQEMTHSASIQPDSVDLTRARETFRYHQARASHSFGITTWKPNSHNESSGRAIFSLSLPSRVKMRALAMEGNQWVLTATQLEYARACKIISRLPSITEDELADKGKGDCTAKALAIVQVIWLVVQLCARAGTEKATSPLEIATLAFAPLSFTTYIILLHHPQDIQTPIGIHASRLPTIDEFRAVAFMAPSYLRHAQVRYDQCFPNDAMHISKQDGHGYASVVFMAGAGVSSFILGCVHLFAWNFQYPNDIERILWITSSFITALVPVLIAGVWAMRITKFAEQIVNGLSEILYPGSLVIETIGVPRIVYFWARMFLLVEMFRSLYFLPPEAFLTTWANNWPHIGG